MNGTGARPDGYDDLRRVLQADAERAARADTGMLWSGVRQAVHRRRRRRQMAGTVAATALSVVVVAAGLQVLPAGQDSARDRLAPGEPSASAVSPSSPPTSSPTPRTPLTERAVAVTPEAARAAFREAGYGQSDLWQLAQVWRWSDVQDVHVVAGARLLRGEVLPLRPGQAAGAADDVAEDELLYQNLLAYTGAGYDDGDSVALAERWGERPTLVRMLVGDLVRAGVLPPATD